MKIIRTGSRESFNDLPLTVDWLLTMNCNYRCSYCFHYGKNNPTPPPPSPFSTLEQLETAVDNLVSLNRPWYNITFSGGEPTVHPRLPDLIPILHEKLQERLNKIEIVTNGSRNECLYKRIAELAKSVNFVMTISLHSDHVEIPHILDLIENLSEDVDMRFILMFNPDKREFVHEIYDKLIEARKKFRFGMSVALIRDIQGADPRYKQEDFVWQKESNARLKELLKTVKLPFPTTKIPSKIEHLFTDVEDKGELKTLDKVDYSLKYMNGMILFKDMYCIAHASLLSIHQDGRCRGMVCNDDPFICNIYEKGTLKTFRDKFIRAIKCTHKFCGCSANYRIPKFSSEEEAKKYVAFAQERQAQLFAEQDLAQKKQATSSAEQDLAQKKQATSSAEQDLAQEKQATSSAEQDLAQKKQATSSAEQDLAQEKQATSPAEQDLAQKKQATSSAEQDLAQKKQATSSAEQDLAQKKQATSSAEQDLAQKKQATPPAEHESYDPNSYEVYLKSIANPLADMPLDSLRNSFPVVI